MINGLSDKQELTEVEIIEKWTIWWGQPYPLILVGETPGGGAFSYGFSTWRTLFGFNDRRTCKLLAIYVRMSSFNDTLSVNQRYEVKYKEHLFTRKVSMFRRRKS